MAKDFSTRFIAKNTQRQGRENLSSHPVRLSAHGLPTGIVIDFSTRFYLRRPAPLTPRLTGGITRTGSR